MEHKKKEVIEIPVGKVFSRMKRNPWMPASFVLAALFLVAVAFAVSGGSVGVSESKVGTNVVNYLNSEVGGGVELDSISKENGLYKITVSYQGDVIPLYATLDGQNIISNLIPLSGSAGAGTTIPTETGSVVTVDTGDAPVLGNVNAPVTIVEFSDYECPFCGRHYSQTYPQLKKDYIDTGKAKLVFMDFPLSFHPNAQKAAEAARCFRDQEGDSGYFEYHDKLFENQQSLSVANYKSWAVEMGANSAEFNNCLDSGKYAQAVQSDLAYGTELGVSGTPGFFINGIKLVGAQPYSAFKQVIDAELQ